MDKVNSNHFDTCENWPNFHLESFFAKKVVSNLPLYFFNLGDFKNDRKMPFFCHLSKKLQKFIKHREHSK